MRGAMRCRRHARSWEYKSAALRYMVWLLAPQLAFVDPSALRYVSRTLIWMHWKTYMEGLSELSPEKRFEVVAWMVDHFDEVSSKGWIKSNGTYVYAERSAEPWGPAVEVDSAGAACGMTRSEVASLIGGSLTGGDLRRLAQGFAWPDSQLIMHRAPLLVAHLHEWLSAHAEMKPEQRRALWFTTDASTGEAQYDVLMRECRTWIPPERKALSERFSSAALKGGAGDPDLNASLPASEVDHG